jgi:hypothetical protein
VSALIAASALWGATAQNKDAIKIRNKAFLLKEWILNLVVPLVFIFL